jgi:hypothetical protein
LQPKQTVRRRDLGPGNRAVHADSHDVVLEQSHADEMK